MDSQAATSSLGVMNLLNHSLSLIKTTLKEAKIWSKAHRKEEKQTTQHIMDQSPPFFLFWGGGLKTGCSFYCLSAPSPTAAGKQRWKEEKRGGHFCIEKLERLIRTSRVKHEKESERQENRENWEEGQTDAERDRWGFKCGWFLMPLSRMFLCAHVCKGSLSMNVWVCVYRWILGGGSWNTKQTHYCQFSPKGCQESLSFILFM